MKKRVIILCAAILLAVTGCTAAVAAASNKAEPEAPADEKGGSDYVLVRHGDGIGVFENGELILEAPVNVDGLRSVDRELIENGIETGSYDDVLKLLEDFGA